MATAGAKHWVSVLDSHPYASRSDDAEFWDAFLAKNPDVLHRLLADVWQATHGAERPPSLDELWALVEAPEFTAQSFGPAVKELLARQGHSVRWLAAQVHVNQKHLGRYLNGEREVISPYDVESSMDRIAAVAGALRVHPSYFAEWRRLWVMRLLDSAFIAHPDLSAQIFKRYAGFDRRREEQSGVSA